MSLYLPFQPSVDQPAGDAEFLRYLRQAVFMVECACIQLLVLQMDIAARILRHVAHHDAAGIGPRLAGKIADVLDGKPRLFHHLAAHALFQRLARFEEACHQPTERAPEVARVHQQHLVLAPLDEHDDGRRDARINLLAALRTPLGDACRLHRPHTATGTEAAVQVPCQYLRCRPRHPVLLEGQHVERGTQVFHHPRSVLASRYGFRQSERACGMSAQGAYLVYGISFGHRHRRFRAAGDMPPAGLFLNQYLAAEEGEPSVCFFLHFFIYL